MEILFKILLIIHIISGATGLITGSINLIRKKGDKKHKVIGRFFSYGMITTGFSGLLMSLLHQNIFLFIVSTFTIYLIGTGNRYLHLKLLATTQKPKAVDWVLTIGMLLMSLSFLAIGVNSILNNNYFGIVLLVFGGFSLMNVKSDFTNYRGKPKAKNYWLLEHIGRMTGGYIAASTAFLVVNSQHLSQDISPVLVWLLPTIVLVPISIKWQMKYRVK